VSRSARRIVFAVASMALVLSTVSVLAPSLAQASHFTDIDTSPFKQDIEWLEETGITTGCSATQFCPLGTVTRGQMAAFLDRALDLDATSQDFFTDDEASMFEASINRLAAANITKGCTATTFCPDATITREQMAAFLDRALDWDSTTRDFFTDDSSSMFEASINRMAAAGVTTGCGNDKFCPLLVVTREQMAAFLHRALPDIGPAPTATPSPSGSASASPSAPTASPTPTATPATPTPMPTPTPATPTPDPNQAPNADDDSPGTVADGCTRLIRVLSNDEDPDGDPISISEVSPATNGTTAQVGNYIAYSHSGGTLGADSFEYTITDGELFDTATVNLTVFDVGDNDGDGIGNGCDPFAAQASSETNNATARPVLTFDGGDGGLEDAGFTGLMTNSIGSSLGFYTDANVSLSGGQLRVASVPEGDAFSAGNDQENAFQVAWMPDGDDFVVHGRVCQPYPTEQFASVGIVFGPGDQENYVKLVVDTNAAGTTAMHDTREINGVGLSVSTKMDAEVAPVACVDLYLQADASAGTYIPTYSIDGGTTPRFVPTGNPRTFPTAWTDGSQPLAIGIISTSNGPAAPFAAAWDLLEVTAVP